MSNPEKVSVNKGAWRAPVSRQQPSSGEACVTEAGCALVCAVGLDRDESARVALAAKHKAKSIAQSESSAFIEVEQTKSE